MLISCDRCATTYTLEDALIPAAGAQVQCTRCGNVFTAQRGGPQRPQAATPAPAPAPSRPKAPAAGGGKTMIFGGPSGALPPEPAKPAPPVAAGSRTMIFGGPSGALPPEPAKPAPPVAAGSRTMIFGGQTAAPPAARQTMIFGGVGDTLPPDAPQPAEVAPAEAPRPQPRAQGGGKTMIFGGPADSPPGADATPAAPAGAGNRTMIFGGPAASPSAPKPKAAPPPSSAPRPGLAAPARRQAASALPPAAEPSARPGGQTMMFGVAAASVTLDGDAQPSSPLTGHTMQFGAPGEAPVTDDSGQVVFGADDARDHPSMLTEGTARIDQSDLERMRRAHEGLDATPPGGLEAAEPRPPAPREKTQLFAMTEAGPGADGPSGEARPRHDKTLLFPMAGGPQEPAAPPEPSARSTQLFAMSDQGPVPHEQARTARTEPALPGAVRPPPPAVDGSAVDTLKPERPSGPRPRLRSSAPVLAATTQPNLALDSPLEVTPREGRVELPPESELPLMAGDTQPSRAEEAAALAAQQGRRNTLALVVLAAVVGLLALGLAWALVGKSLLARLTGSEIPLEAEQTAIQAVDRLWTDDAEARAANIGRLRTLIAQYPRQISAHAALVTALALSFEDAQERSRRTADTCGELEALVKQLESPTAPQGSDFVAGALRARLKKLKPAQEDLQTYAAAVEADLTAAVQAMDAEFKPLETPTRAQAQAVLRATALREAARGDPHALESLGEWRQTNPEPEREPWAELVVPMAALNRQPQISTDVATSIGPLKALVARETSQVRAMVLLARALFDTGDVEAAQEVVERVLLIRKEHQVAQDLRTRIADAQAGRKTSERLSAPRAPPSP